MPSKSSESPRNSTENDLNRERDLRERELALRERELLERENLIRERETLREEIRFRNSKSGSRNLGDRRDHVQDIEDQIDSPGSRYGTDKMTMSNEIRQNYNYIDRQQQRGSPIARPDSIDRMGRGRSRRQSASSRSGGSDRNDIDYYSNSLDSGESNNNFNRTRNRKQMDFQTQRPIIGLGVSSPNLGLVSPDGPNQKRTNPRDRNYNYSSDQQYQQDDVDDHVSLTGKRRGNTNGMVTIGQQQYHSSNQKLHRLTNVPQSFHQREDDRESQYSSNSESDYYREDRLKYRRALINGRLNSLDKQYRSDEDSDSTSSQYKANERRRRQERNLKYYNSNRDRSKDSDSRHNSFQRSRQETFERQIALARAKQSGALGKSTNNVKKLRSTDFVTVGDSDKVQGQGSAGERDGDNINHTNNLKLKTQSQTVVQSQLGQQESRSSDVVKNDIKKGQAATVKTDINIGDASLKDLMSLNTNFTQFSDTQTQPNLSLQQTVQQQAVQAPIGKAKPFQQDQKNNLVSPPIGKAKPPQNGTVSNTDINKNDNVNVIQRSPDLEVVQAPIGKARGQQQLASEKNEKLNSVAKPFAKANSRGTDFLTPVIKDSTVGMIDLGPIPTPDQKQNQSLDQKNITQTATGTDPNTMTQNVARPLPKRKAGSDVNSNTTKIDINDTVTQIHSTDSTPSRLVHVAKEPDVSEVSQLIDNIVTLNNDTNDLNNSNTPCSDDTNTNSTKLQINKFDNISSRADTNLNLAQSQTSQNRSNGDSGPIENRNNDNGKYINNTESKLSGEPAQTVNNNNLNITNTDNGPDTYSPSTTVQLVFDQDQSQSQDTEKLHQAPIAISKARAPPPPGPTSQEVKKNDIQNIVNIIGVNLADQSNSLTSQDLDIKNGSGVGQQSGLGGNLGSAQKLYTTTNSMSIKTTGLSIVNAAKLNRSSKERSNSNQDISQANLGNSNNQNYPIITKSNSATLVNTADSNIRGQNSFDSQDSQDSKMEHKLLDLIFPVNSSAQKSNDTESSNGQNVKDKSNVIKVSGPERDEKILNDISESDDVVSEKNDKHDEHTNTNKPLGQLPGVADKDHNMRPSIFSDGPPKKTGNINGAANNYSAHPAYLSQWARKTDLSLKEPLNIDLVRDSLLQRAKAGVKGVIDTQDPTVANATSQKRTSKRFRNNSENGHDTNSRSRSRSRSDLSRNQYRSSAAREIDLKRRRASRKNEKHQTSYDHGSYSRSRSPRSGSKSRSDSNRRRRDNLHDRRRDYYDKHFDDSCGPRNTARNESEIDFQKPVLRSFIRKQERGEQPEMIQNNISNTRIVQTSKSPKKKSIKQAATDRRSPLKFNHNYDASNGVSASSSVSHNIQRSRSSNSREKQNLKHRKADRESSDLVHQRNSASPGPGRLFRDAATESDLTNNNDRLNNNHSQCSESNSNDIISKENDRESARLVDTNKGPSDEISKLSTHDSTSAGQNVAGVTNGNTTNNIPNLAQTKPRSGPGASNWTEQFGTNHVKGVLKRMNMLGIGSSGNINNNNHVAGGPGGPGQGPGSNYDDHASSLQKVEEEYERDLRIERERMARERDRMDRIKETQRRAWQEKQRREMREKNLRKEREERMLREDRVPMMEDREREDRQLKEDISIRSGDRDMNLSDHSNKNNRKSELERGRESKDLSRSERQQMLLSKSSHNRNQSKESVCEREHGIRDSARQLQSKGSNYNHDKSNYHSCDRSQSKNRHSINSTDDYDDINQDLRSLNQKRRSRRSISPGLRESAARESLRANEADRNRPLIDERDYSNRSRAIYGDSGNCSRARLNNDSKERLRSSYCRSKNFQQIYQGKNDSDSENLITKSRRRQNADKHCQSASGSSNATHSFDKVQGSSESGRNVTSSSDPNQLSSDTVIKNLQSDESSGRPDQTQTIANDVDDTGNSADLNNEKQNTADGQNVVLDSRESDTPRVIDAAVQQENSTGVKSSNIQTAQQVLMSNTTQNQILENIKNKVLSEVKFMKNVKSSVTHQILKELKRDIKKEILENNSFEALKREIINISVNDIKKDIRKKLEQDNEFKNDIRNTLKLNDFNARNDATTSVLSDPDDCQIRYDNDGNYEADRIGRVRSNGRIRTNRLDRASESEQRIRFSSEQQHDSKLINDQGQNQGDLDHTGVQDIDDMKCDNQRRSRVKRQDRLQQHYWTQDNDIDSEMPRKGSKSLINTNYNVDSNLNDANNSEPNDLNHNDNLSRTQTYRNHSTRDSYDMKTKSRKDGRRLPVNIDDCEARIQPLNPSDSHRRAARTYSDSNYKLDHNHTVSNRDRYSDRANSNNLDSDYYHESDRRNFEVEDDHKRMSSDHNHNINDQEYINQGVKRRKIRMQNDTLFESDRILIQQEDNPNRHVYSDDDMFDTKEKRIKRKMQKKE